MDMIEVELLRREVDVLAGALAQERFRHVAGIEPSPALTPIFRAHSRAAHRETVQALEAQGEAELASRVALLRVERAQAEDEEAWRAAEAGASGQGPDGAIGLDAAQLGLIHEHDRGRRLAFGAAVAAAAAASSPRREAALETRARARSEVGVLPDWERVLAADALLGASDDAYRDVLGWLGRKVAGLAPPPQGDLARADLLHVLALEEWSGLFRPGMLALELEQLAAALKLQLGGLRVDQADRPGQWPGAHAFEARISFRRQGGAADWLGLFSAAGQGLAAAAVPPHRRHAAATFTMGDLLSGLLLEPGFLRARLEVEKKHAADLVRALAVRQLFRLRARAAALRVATEVERGTTGAAWHEAHREALALASLAAWPHGLAGRDGDGDAHAAALQGAARAAQLRQALIQRFDEDWWRNPRSAEQLGTWLAAGGAWAGDEPQLSAAAVELTKKMQ
jgi:hypothetical protein